MSERTDYREDDNLRELLRRAEEELPYDEDKLDEDFDEEEYDEEGYEYEGEEYDNKELPEDLEVEATPSPSEANPAIEATGRFGLDGLNKDRITFGIILLLTVCLTALWKFYYNSNIRQLAETEEVLKDLRYRHLQSTAELIELEQISKVEEGIDKYELNLEHSTQPPYYVIDTLKPQRRE